MLIEFCQPFNTPYSRQLANGVLTYAATHVDVTVTFRHAPVLSSEKLPMVDGVIGFEQYALRFAAKNGIPAINPSSNPTPGISIVSTDNQLLCDMVVDHFREKSLQTMALLVDTSVQVALPRKQAFRSACLQRGYLPHMISFAGMGKLDAKNVAVGQALKALPKPAALMLLYDDYGPGLLQLCNEIGIRVPEDIAVVGVNNFVDLASDSPSILSSVDINAQKIGYEAARLLIKVLNGESIPSHTFIPPRELVARHSSNVVIALDPNVSKALTFMRTHLHDDLELDDVLRQQGLGRRALEKHFKRHLDTTPMLHLRNLRLEKAQSLLASTKLTVTEIGRQCGIPDTNYLCRLFRKLYETTPLKYRAQNTPPHN